MEAVKVGIREFRENLAKYLRGADQPRGARAKVGPPEAVILEAQLLHLCRREHIARIHLLIWDPPWHNWIIGVGA